MYVWALSESPEKDAAVEVGRAEVRSGTRASGHQTEIGHLQHRVTDIRHQILEIGKIDNQKISILNNKMINNEKTNCDT